MRSAGARRRQWRCGNRRSGPETPRVVPRRWAPGWAHGQGRPVWPRRNGREPPSEFDGWRSLPPCDWQRSLARGPPRPPTARSKALVPWRLPAPARVGWPRCHKGRGWPPAPRDEPGRDHRGRPPTRGLEMNPAASPGCRGFASRAAARGGWTPPLARHRRRRRRRPRHRARRAAVRAGAETPRRAGRQFRSGAVASGGWPLLTRTSFAGPPRPRPGSRGH